MAVVVIEAPGKIDTVSRNFPASSDKIEVVATHGHLFDLPEYSLGIEENRITMVAIRADLVRSLRAALEAHREIYVATDPDREGEVIAAQVFELCPPGRKVLRVYPRSLDRSGLESAMAAALPEPDRGLAMAGLTRRVVDRLIGFTLSRKAAKVFGENVSIGRVKSAVLRRLHPPVKRFAYVGKLVFALGFEGVAVCDCVFRGPGRLPKNARTGWHTVARLSGISARPASPVTTARLLMDHAKHGVFRSFSAYRGAQDLYEQGLLSYVRTRENVVTEPGLDMARELIRLEGTGKTVSLEPSLPVGGHESIRPAWPLSPDDIGVKLTGEQRSLYRYVHDAFLAAACEKKTTEIRAKVKAAGTVYDALLTSDHPDIEEIVRPGAVGFGRMRAANAEIRLHDLIRWMDSKRIGTPGTYVSSISGLMESEYATPGLGVTDKGMRVLDWLDRNAPWLTAETSQKLEELLEGIRDGKSTYQEVFDALRDFSASGPSRNVEIPKIRKDPALALKETVQTLYPSGSGGHSL